MKRKKGFTLIELLAVIVILAIIALIATPIILGIVEDARKDSFMRSVELVIKTTDIDIFNKEYTDTYTYTINDGNVSNLEVGVKNTDGMNGSIIYDKNGNDKYAIHNGKYCVIKEEGMKKAEIKDYVEGECKILIPTDVIYFDYIELLTDISIVDVEKCIDFYINVRQSEENMATTFCNNEKWGGMTLTERANQDPAGYSDLIKAGILDGTPTNIISILQYSEEGPKDVVIPSRINGKEVVSIYDSAFIELELTSVVIPEGVVEIESFAFYGNYLQEIVIPEGVTNIGYGSFAKNSLKKVVIPKTVTHINNPAFYDNLLQEVIFKNDDIILTAGSFCDNAVQAGSEAYQTIYSINPDALVCPPPESPN